MIARTRPEARLGEIAKAWFSVSRHGKEAVCDEFARWLLLALSLEGEPVLVPSGRAGLYALFRALPLKRVYLPAYTCWVVLEAARLAGKEVEFLDIEYPSLNLRMDEIERIRDDPGIVVATHQFGYPEDVEAILGGLAKGDHIVIEDCAGAMFCQLRGSPLGGRGLAALFSFEAGKLFTLGRGGLIVTRDTALARRIREELDAIASAGRRSVLRRLALRRLSTSPFMYRALLPLYLMLREPTEGMQRLSGTLTADYCETFSTFQAHLGMLLAARIDAVAKRRRSLFELYERAAETIPGFTPVTSLPASVITPIRYPILAQSRNKRAVYDGMRARGVDMGFSYSYSLADAHKYPGAARFGAEVLNLPLYADLAPSNAEYVVTTLRAISAS
jgi:dTDP-4-amino-4,6-dideoxygalactose transaminase